MLDDRGRAIEAGPSTPVEVSGLDEMPEAGDRFFVVEDLEQAREVAEDRRDKAREQGRDAAPTATLANMLEQIEAGKATELRVILKADVQGSIEALRKSLAPLGNDGGAREHAARGRGRHHRRRRAAGGGSPAIILGFNVVADPGAQLAEEKGVDIRTYRIIYEIIEEMGKALEGLLAPEITEKTLGRADVREVFKVSRVGTVAGCIVTDGVVNRNAKVRIIRNNIVVEDERTLDSLKRFKDDVREVRAGMECGLKIAGYDDIKEGDMLEFYQPVEVARKQPVAAGAARSPWRRRWACCT